jgi:putative ABC transport system substrate-binding protein
MKRRELIAAVGGAAMAWPLAVRAQQSGPMRRIGLLMGSAEGDSNGERGLTAFRDRLQQAGWTEGRNIRLDVRWAGSDVGRIQVLAKELIDLKPDLLVAHSTAVVVELQRQTKSIPIVFFFVSDPVGSGVVASLPRPGGNATGFINIEASLGGKWIELLKEIMPSLKRAGLMFNPDTATYAHYYTEPFEVAAHSRGVEPVVMPVRNDAEIERAVETLSDRPDTALALMPDIFTGAKRTLIISLAARHRLPTIYPYRFMAADGGLISYGIDQIDLFRRAAGYVDRVLKGEKPADLPVQLPTRFELAVNLKTAKALGLEMPAMLLGRADEVIE